MLEALGYNESWLCYESWTKAIVACRSRCLGDEEAPPCPWHALACQASCRQVVQFGRPTDIMGVGCTPTSHYDTPKKAFGSRAAAKMMRNPPPPPRPHSPPINGGDCPNDLLICQMTPDDFGGIFQPISMVSLGRFGLQNVSFQYP